MLARNSMTSKFFDDFLEDIGRQILRREPPEMFEAEKQHETKDESVD